MKKRLSFLLLLAAVAAAVVFLRFHGRSSAPAAAYSGYGEGELVYISSPLGGELEALEVRRGDWVEKGAALFTLERGEEKAALAEADETLQESLTRLDKAKRDFDRAKNLRDKRVTAPEAFDTAEQAVLGAQHATAARQRGVEQAQWRFQQKEQTAPGDGLVFDTYFRPGEWVPPGTPIVALLPPEAMKVRFFVPAADLGKIPIGAPLEIRMDGLPEALPGRVSFVSPQAEYTLPIIYSRENRGKLVFLVEGSLAPEHARRLHPGAPIEVRLPVSAPPTAEP
ncbi:MAG TPA: efflux RND transporter periplasmic adaptor subunit [Terrimicrobiaceae bacterium]|nr:efflux RND transporter periplasmic adaptor subunit [Terrimicrobiaceae bacterium]